MKMSAGPFFAITLGLAASGCGDLRQPSLVLESQRLDVGFVPPGGKQIRIPITNNGSADLMIESIQTSCKCAVAQPVQAVPAGGTEVLSLDLKSRPGPQLTRIALRSNDPNGPHEVLITWYGESPPTLDPPVIRAEHLAPKQKLVRTVTLAYRGGDSKYPLQVANIVSSHGQFTLKTLNNKNIAKVPPSDVPGGNLQPIVGETLLVFECDAPPPGVSLVGECAITYSIGGHEDSITLPVEIVGAESISFVPSRAYFSAANHVSLIGTKRSLLLRTTLPGEPRVVQCPPMLKTHLTRLPVETANYRYKLELEICTSTKAKFYNGSVVVQVGEESNSRVSIPVELVSLD
jgi:hypothetical protein